MVEYVDWYLCEIDRKNLKKLMQRSDAKALSYIVPYVFILGLLGAVSVIAWGSWTGVAAYVAYGAMFGCLASLQHETHHGTPFKTRWMNEAVHWVAGLLAVKEPFSDRWLHTRHHTYTYQTGTDLEIQTERPPSILKILLDFFRIPWVAGQLRTITEYAFRPLPAVILEAPAEEQRKIVWSSRAILGFYVAVVIIGALTGNWFPLLLTLGAKISGGWLHAFMGYTQHTGMPENVSDHRLNTRTVYTNPVLQFLYWNMNFHIEHHMYPMVPFYSLPELHRLLKPQMPPAYRGFTAAWREMIPVLFAQIKDPNYFVDRKLHFAEAE